VAPPASTQPTVIVTAPNATISGTVFNDVNGNGAFDSGTDTGLGGVTVLLSGTSSGSTTTLANGTYTFIGLAPGAFSVDYTTPTGYGNTSLTRPITGIVLAPGGSSTGSNFFVRRSTTTSLTTTTNPSSYGSALTFTATVTSASGTNPSTGTVTFLDEATPICSAVSLIGNTAACSTSSLSASGSPRSISAQYNGTTTAPGYSGSTSNTVTQAITKAALSVTVDANDTTAAIDHFTKVYGSANPPFGIRYSGFVNGDTSASLGGTLVFTTSATAASPVGSYAVTPSGLTSGNYTITFVDGFLDVTQAPSTTVVTCPSNATYTGSAIEPCSAQVTGAGALNSPVTPVTYSNNLDAGTASASATYPGDANHTGSTGTATFTIDQADTTTGLTSSVNLSVFGQSVTFTATVAAVAPGAGTPTGTVTFKDGLTSLGSSVLNGSAQATLSTAGLSVGSHSITAVYSGDPNFNGSTASTLRQDVNKANTTTTLVNSTNPSVFGQSVTFTATVTAVAPGAGTPTGTVTFFDGVTLLGSSSLNGSGVATISTAGLSVASHSITAVYGDESNFNGSTSSILTQDVNKANTTTVLTSSANPSVFGQSVTFTATVTAVAPGAGVPTGTVTFYDGLTLLGSGSLNGSGVATLSTSSLSVGSHPITATYNADSSFNGSTSSILSQLVNKASTTTTVASSLNPAILGQVITFTATVNPVAPGAGTPTGTVQFFDGPTLLGSGLVSATGVATLSTSSLTVGGHVITAVYGGDVNFNGSTGALLGGQQVSYRFDGFLQPINDTAHELTCGPTCPISIFKAGSTVPVKFDLKRADGTLVSATVLPIFVGPVKGGPTTSPIDEGVYADPPSGGSTFSASGGHYQYNWSTKGLQAGYYYRIGARLDDGTTWYVYIGLR
jgi:hypothetical protein